MKKAVYVVTSLLLPWATSCMQITAAQPQSPPQTGASSLFNQWRVGFGLAVEYLNMEAKLKLQPDPVLKNIGTQHSQTGKHLQLAPCLEFGSAFGNSYYLGLMVSWRYSSLKINTDSPIGGRQYFGHQFKLNHYADMLVKAGYKMTPRIMFYGLIGPTLANWTHNSNQFKLNNLIEDKFGIKKTSVGLGLGIGIECNVHKNHALSVSYTHHLHSSVSKSQSMSYQEAPLRPVLVGALNKKIDLSYGTIAVRFTTFFSL